MRSFSSLLAGGVCALALATAAAAAPANIMFVMDASGSMKKDAGNGFSRMDNAQYAIARILTDVDQENRYGLTVYGHRRAKACDDIQVVAHVGSVDAGFVNEFVQTLEPKGETPIAASVKLAAASFEKLPGENNQLVVVTDGIEECGGNVCALADELAAKHLDLKVNVVGFTLNQQQKSLITCLADKTGGKFYDAQNGEALEAAFKQVKHDIAQAKTAPAAKPKTVQPPGPTVWFEDNFDGASLGEHWHVNNENPDGYAVEDGKLLVIFADHGKPSNTIATAENIFRLSQDLPKGDWTMSARFIFNAQTHSEWLRFGVSTDAEKSMLGSFNLHPYNYARTTLSLHSEKVSGGKASHFGQPLRHFDDGNIANRSQAFAEAIEAMELKLEKRGRNYTVSGKLDGSGGGKWIEIQKMTSIKSPGNAMTLMFGTAGNQYAPSGGEAFVEVDWVKVTTP